MVQLLMDNYKEENKMENKLKITPETGEVVVKEDAVNIVVTDEVHQETILFNCMEEMNLLAVQHNPTTKPRHKTSLHILKVLWQKLLRRQIQRTKTMITYASSAPTQISTTL